MRRAAASHLTHLFVAAKYRSDVAPHDDGMFQSQHSYGSFDTPITQYRPPQSFRRGIDPELAYEDSASASSFYAHPSERRAAAPAIDQGG